MRTAQCARIHGTRFFPTRSVCAAKINVYNADLLCRMPDVPRPAPPARRCPRRRPRPPPHLRLPRKPASTGSSATSGSTESFTRRRLTPRTSHRFSRIWPRPETWRPRPSSKHSTRWRFSTATCSASPSAEPIAARPVRAEAVGWGSRRNAVCSSRRPSNFGP